METRGEYIKRLRGIMGMTAEDLARKLGVNFTTLWRWETRRVNRIHIGILREVERIFKEWSKTGKIK